MSGGPPPLPHVEAPAWKPDVMLDGELTPQGHKKVPLWTEEQFKAVGAVAGQFFGMAPLMGMVAGPAAAKAFVDAGVKMVEAMAAAPKWSVADIKAEWAKTARGKEILKNLPASTKFEAYEKPPGDKTNAYYDPKTNTVYIPASYTSAEAAPTAGHESVHADQVVNHGRPKDNADLIEMEVEAKNAGLDVYDQMGKPALPYNYKSESDFRAKDQAAYDAAVRAHYKKQYGVP
jgi:hypothetical protein